MSDKEKILKMVADGKISVEDAEKLLKAIGETRGSAPKSKSLMSFKEKIKKSMPNSGKLVVEIQSVKGENVKLRVPLKLANFVLKMIPKDKLFDFQKDGIDLKELLTNVSSLIDESDDDILNITSASGDSIRIYVERR